MNTNENDKTLLDEKDWDEDNKTLLDKKDLDDGDENSLKPGYSVDDNSVYPATVEYSKESYSILELYTECYDYKNVELTPPYQRGSDVWDNKRKSELIESILMGMPLPILYFFADEKGKWQVVDGVQRMTAFFEYMGDKFKLSDKLNILKEIRNKKFSELSKFQQGVIRRYQLQIYVIKPPTPDRVKFDIFDRVNRGGVRLNNQEMRNAIYNGVATDLLNRLSNNTNFKDATENSVNARMKDRYIILRFLGFYLLYSRKDILFDSRNNKIEYKSDIDDFLGKIMSFINKNPNISNELESIFNKSIAHCYDILGKGCFRVSNYKKYDRDLPLNMALFESLMFLCCFDSVTLDKLKTKELVHELINESTFENYIRVQPVDSTVKVDGRFSMVDQLLKRL